MHLPKHTPDIVYDVMDQLPEGLLPERLGGVPLLEATAFAALSILAWRRNHKVLAAGLAVGSVAVATPGRPVNLPQTVEYP